MRRVISRLIICLIAGAILLPRGGNLSAADLSAKQVVDSIDKAKRKLLKAQQRDGSWKTGGGNDQYPVGVTSLALMALLNSGKSVDDAEIERGLNWLRRQEPSYTYEISLMIQALAAARDGEHDISKVRALARDLEEMQIRQGPNAGSWSYSKNMRVGGGDRSNAHFAVAALREAQEMGIPISLETWRRVRDHWLASQNEDGGWSYSGGPSPKGSTGSMTVAGVATLVITRGMLRSDDADIKIDQSLTAASHWLGNNFTVTNNPGDGRWLLYYLSGLERAGRFSGRRFFTNNRGRKHDWYREGAEYLVSTQNPTTGTWQEGQSDAIVGTSFVLMFLSKGMAPVAINKLQYGPRDPNRDVVAGNDWNRHPDDARNLTHFLSYRPKWPRLINWQTVDIAEATPADLKQAPLLFISGSEAPQFTPADVALLKDYIDEGGFIFADNCGKSDAFDKGFRELVGQMFPEPDAQLKRLTGDHALFRSEFSLLDAKTREPTVELWGVSLRGRAAIIYSPHDISRLWDKWTSFEVPGRTKESAAEIDRAMHVGANIVAYATGREFGNKLEPRE